MPQSDKIDQVSAALLQAQAKIGPVVRNGTNPYYDSKYATRDSVLQAIKSPCQAAGLVVTQFPVGQGMTTKLIHPVSGQWIEEHVEFSYDKKGPQAQGACLTYLSRYSLCLIFLIELPDDDAEGATSRQKPAKSEPKTYNASDRTNVRQRRSVAEATITVQGILKGLEKAKDEARVQEIMTKCDEYLDTLAPDVQHEIYDKRDEILAGLVEPPGAFND